TRSKRDWSSDVCSSDLHDVRKRLQRGDDPVPPHQRQRHATVSTRSPSPAPPEAERIESAGDRSPGGPPPGGGPIGTPIRPDVPPAPAPPQAHATGAPGGAVPRSDTAFQRTWPSCAALVHARGDARRGMALVPAPRTDAPGRGNGRDRPALGTVMGGVRPRDRTP